MKLLKGIWNCIWLPIQAVTFVVAISGTMIYYKLKPGWRYDWELGAVRTAKKNNSSDKDAS